MRWMCLMLVAIVTVGRSAERADAEDHIETARLTVHVTDLRNARGHLRVGIFDKADGFPKQREGAVMWASLDASERPRTILLDLPPGEYAAVVLHDENSNKRLDTNWLGIPKEGYGVTNNPKPAFRAATYEEARFELPASGAEMTVSIQYF